jgi:serine/threonine protein kinase
MDLIHKEVKTNSGRICFYLFIFVIVVDLIEELVGEGSYTCTYKATFKQDNESYVKAIKVFKKNTEEELIRNININCSKELESAYVITYEETFDFEGQKFVVMKLMDGSLKSMLDSLKSQKFKVVLKDEVFFFFYLFMLCYLYYLGSFANFYTDAIGSL